jgi:hypothetical protein
VGVAGLQLIYGVRHRNYWITYSAGVPLTKTMNAIPILFWFLLQSSIERSVTFGQIEFQDRSPASATAPEKTSAPSDRRIFIATLPKTVDVKRLNAGDTVAAVALVLTPPSITLLGRILEVHALGSGNKDSLLLIRFEKVKFGNNQEVPVHLRLQAVAAPLALKQSVSPIIVDRYPCDYQADPKGCEEKAQKQDHIWQPQIGGMTTLVCEKNPKDKGQPIDDCVPASLASGIYGFPDLSVAYYPGASGQDFAITSVKKDVHLEQGTVLIFSGSDAEMTQKP